MRNINQSSAPASNLSLPNQNDQQPPEIRFQTQLSQLVDMGFFNPQQNIQALTICGGNVEMALEWLFSRPPQ